MDDPIVDEVRRNREELAARFNHDLEAIVAYLKEQERALPQRVVSLGPKRLASAGKQENSND